MAMRSGNKIARRTLRDIVRSQRGETITEVLVSMVIAGLALLMLATVIATSSSIVRNSRAAMESYYDTTNKLESYSETGKTGTITPSVPLAIGSTGSAVNSISVQVYVEVDGSNTIATYTETSS